MLVYDIQDLVKTYPGQSKPVNDRITLQIEEGEIFGILGDNGAGKSTLVRQMVNLLTSSAGTIQFLGKDITTIPDVVRMNVGYMPQESGAVKNLTIAESLYFTAHLRGMSRRDAREECDRLLHQWKMVELRDQPAARLSGGQLRLLRLAVTMAGSPPVLILDEPTNDLDPQRRKLVWDNLRQLNQKQGTTIIFITHDAIEAEKAIQRVGIMRAGTLVAIGRPRDLKRQVDRLLRLELFFEPEHPPTLPADLTCDHPAPGHWRAFLEWHQVESTLNRLDLTQIDDFRLYSATLEDLYLHYASNS
ncbi:ABC transporter ATP-binding protein [Oscillatoria sp. FACHB-1407]|uniref:ABC transporter ATP-binding protein n=1 Tax=Oscillatoria sp. FACHB-1407 TaxID=2692847 RepID=UPI00168428F1|nr:ABC transporter ATP-binding protein [Oscillatoria sp. FACHB-1407]MBD2463101.1 ABC transporter ATP-binding protein [Oscillatoria sp. FACHB-1407]